MKSLITMMSYLYMKTTIASLFVAALALCSLAGAESNVRDLNPPAKVTGYLGKPLGTRMTIAGVFAEDVMLTNPMAVSEIDGQPLKDNARIEIRGKLQIRKGVRYRLEGYEAGEFSGPPSWLSPAAQQPFQYRSFFVVTKVIDPVERQ
ncbi:MAG: hypothetical protein NTW21_31695 [Verrucomicrobia bacterium]|nr:hypothetical protein [Verrucomicrobiota bacterium]